MTALSDTEYLSRAVTLAARGLYTTDPNPRVGCVLVKDGRVIGEGWHERAGGLHAERMALSHAGAAASGATVFVTLEPCSSTGRTGPCTTALIEANVARVVCSGIDPNLEVAGRGISALRDAGIRVDVGVAGDAAAALNPGYLSRMTRGRPFVRTKLAVSLDGRTALANGQSQWITGPAARVDVHRWRARSRAIMTGIGTVLADDPSLDARLEDPEAAVQQPARVVLDSACRIPPEARLLSIPGAVLIFTNQAESKGEGELVARGATIERVGGSSQCDLAQVLNRLGELEFNEVWVEAGAALNGALVREGLIDELIIYMAPQLLGSSATGMFAIDSLDSLEQRISLTYQDVRRVGDDLRIIAQPSTVTSQQSER